MPPPAGKAKSKGKPPQTGRQSPRLEGLPKKASSAAESSFQGRIGPKSSRFQGGARKTRQGREVRQAALPGQREASAPVSTRPAAGRTRPAPAARLKPLEAEELGLEEFSIALIKPGETKERIWRTKNFHQMEVQREFGFPDVAPELPGQYHQDKLVLMPKDPEYMFCYWELTPNLIDEKSREKVPEGNYRETLKINWESRSLFEPNFTFIPVFFWARKWYFGVPQVGQRYQVELGWLSDTGHFISIIRSNLSELPESWAQTQKRLSEQGDVLAYTARHNKIIGSSEHLAVEDTRAFVPEWNLSSESFSSSSWSRGAGDAAPRRPRPPRRPSPRPGPAKPAKPSPAVPKARLEVSGKVLPGTKVSVGGKTVAIDGLGFFKTDFPYEQDVLKLDLTDRSRGQPLLRL